jgi:hypothetical protein
MERIKPSDPKYKRLNELADSIAQAKNPQVWFDINKKVQSGEIDKLMIPVAVSDLEDEMDKALKK